MSYHILLAEDDEDIIKLLKLYLENEVKQIFVATNGVDALEIVRNNKIDIAVLDIMMPKMDGYELTREIRKISNMPILILSAKNQDNDKILGLNLGADDYLAKPFNPLEVVARIKSNLRRCYQLSEKAEEKTETDKLTLGELILNTAAFTLTKNGSEIPLTATEYKILVLFMKKPGRIFTKVQIYESIRGEYFENDDSTMTVHIAHLREKIEDDPKNPRYIKTVRGLGYKFEKEQTR